MLTIHAAPLVLPVGAAPVVDGAVAVDGDTVASVGPYEQVAAAHPAARVRRWPGVLTPGLRQWHGLWLLTRAYHPDPREYDELGDRPLTGERLAALDMTETRRAGSVRRGLQQMLRHGTTALAGSFHEPVVATAVARSGLRVVSALRAPGVLAGEPDLDPLRETFDLAGAVGTPLTVGARADLAAFDAPDEAALLAAGAGTCVATVLGGRLVYRGR
ncbi:hypothetical protein BLA24_14230 [Streptomyces cinnamoneus]|uniref:Aminodeoxyfutalosine deaminase/Imidazolonepropionase-like composite domain-containing protein n=1 Tax=Streptomyces cinnamoneus TaxID=53446 RepID=A0A2G1XIA3_STRCJ|nr:hypothetical protein [Streptomyces cinnamoneus]PHQ50950.1 hypothetical protein BLA24_14230 [Streptomyces cinnamoneus]PPT13829.1 hypothetical protein CYQ11_13845 [Streptomyces cinnamoneus]